MRSGGDSQIQRRSSVESTDRVAALRAVAHGFQPWESRFGFFLQARFSGRQNMAAVCSSLSPAEAGLNIFGDVVTHG